ncbi:hypothetical protein Taro_003181, partial [Colocasia esculenta]|nr:hypothetical protein [Colocasia esculenta]
KARVGKERRHHTGTDYWLIRPVSNPDNTTQEQPLSLAVTDERSNCRSTRKKSNNCGDQPTPRLQTHNCRSMPGTSRGLWPDHPKVRHWKTGLAGDQ